MATVEDTDDVWRRIPKVLVVHDPKADGGLRSSKEAWRDDNDGDPMSVYCARMVAELGHDVSAVLAGRPPGWAVAALLTGYLRHEEEQIVRHDPDLSAPTPDVCAPAHVQVIGDKPKARRERMARQARIVLRT